MRHRAEKMHCLVRRDGLKTVEHTYDAREERVRRQHWPAQRSQKMPLKELILELFEG